MAKTPTPKYSFEPIIGPTPQRPVTFLANYGGVGRPSTVSAVAGIGLAVGIVSLLACVSSIGVAGGIMFVSISAARQVQNMAPAALPVSTPSQPVSLSVPLPVAEASADGFPSETRIAFVGLMRRPLPMTAAQEQQLDALLRESGRLIFDGVLPTTDAGIDGAINDHGALPSPNTDSTPVVFFVTRRGRTQLYDDRAVFYPSDGSPVVRATAGHLLNATGHPVLNSREQDLILGLVSQTSGGKLNALQRRSLANLFKQPDQTLVAITGSSDLPSVGISGVSRRPGGYIVISFGGGALVLSPTGHVVLSGEAASGASAAAALIVVLESLASAGLAVRLIVLSRRLMSQKLLTGRSHVRWSIGKLVSAIVGGVAFGVLIQSFLRSIPASADKANEAGIIAGLCVTIVGGAFPIIAMILLSVRPSKLYFDGVI